MSDEPGAERDREERVRRLLADARHDAPVPADVAARIDEALRGLRTGDAAEGASAAPGAESVAGPGAAPLGHPADELAARRRRRRWTAGLSAAAVVVVVGVGAGATGLLGSGSDVGGSSESAAGADSAEDQGTAPSEVPETERDVPPTLDPDAPADGRSLGPFEEFDAEALPGRVPVLRSGPGLRADVTAAVREAPAVERARGDDTGCAPAGTPGKVVDVRWDGARAELVLDEPADGSREVALHSCAGTPGPPDRVFTVPVR